MGVSVHTIGARVADLAALGAFEWRTRDTVGVIRRVIELAHTQPRTLRGLAVRWNDAQHERGLASRTLARQWGTLVSLLGALEVAGLARATIGAMPRGPARTWGCDGVAPLLAELVADGRHRDAVIVGLLGELGLEHRDCMALRVRDARALACSAPLAAALARVCEGQAPQAPALRGPHGRALSSPGFYHVCESLGTSVAELRRVAAAPGAA